MDRINTFMKNLALKIVGVAILALLLFAPFSFSHAARTDTVWDVGPTGTYIKTTQPNGWDILINGISKYLNFGSTVGSSGYGIRDNAGRMEFKHSGESWTEFGTGGGGGSSIVLDLADDGSNESAGITEIATSGDTNSIFSEPTANKLLINLGLDWPKADTADDLTCTDCIGATEITDIYVLNTGDTLTGDLELDGDLVLNLDDTGTIRFSETDANGANFKGFTAPTAITASTTCTFEDDANFIPDSCVGDGVDSDTATPSVGSAGAIQVSDGAGAFLGSLIDNFYYDDAADVLYLLDETTTYFKAGDYSTGFNFDAGGITVSTIRTYTGPNLDGTLALTSGAQTFSDKTIDSDVNTLSVDPDEFKAVDSPADEECYTYESTGTTGEWQTCGGGGGAPTDADYLVGTANGSLSAEIVVGTSPGGELGGTWASPTLDDSVTTTGWTMGTFSATQLTSPTVLVDLLDAVGAVDMDYGSADVTDHTFTTDGTGTAEIVLPDGSIDGTEILNDTVALTTDTSGNYVSSATANGGLTLTGTEGGSLGILLPAATNALSSTTSSGSGLELLSAGLTLLQGCADTQVLAWVESTDTWDCSTVSGSGDITSVGDVTSGAAFDGTQGTTITFNDADGDKTFKYDTTNNWFELNDNIAIGSAGVLLTDNGDGALTLKSLGNTAQEDLKLDLDGNSDTVNFSSTTGLHEFNFADTTNSKIFVQTLSLTGTGALEGLDSIDSTGETTLEAALDLAGDVSATGLGNTVIGNDKITEAMLKAVDVAADEECLTYESTVGDFEWQTCGAGGSFDSTTVDNTTWSDNANASNTWTFDVSGTDTTWTMGNNNWIFGTGSVDLGSAGVRLSQDGDGAITFLGLGNGSDEDLTLNLDDTSNTGVFSSSTSLATLNFSGISLQSSGVAIPTISSTDTLTNKTIAAASNVLDACVPVAVTDEYSNLTTGTAKATFRMPFAMTVTSVRASLVTAATGGTLVTVDINEAGTSIISTKITLDASEKTSTTAATAAVISDSSIADDAEMTVDIDAVGSTTPGNGLKIQICGTI